MSCLSFAARAESLTHLIPNPELKQRDQTYQHSSTGIPVVPFNLEEEGKVGVAGGLAVLGKHPTSHEGFLSNYAKPTNVSIRL